MSVVVPNPYKDLTPDDKRRWVMFYPAYINAKKTIAAGRRVRKEVAVDTPTCTEIRDVCVSQELNIEVELNRHYPREQARDNMHAGRVRVQLYDRDGTPCNPKITSKKQLFHTACELIPKLKTRQSRGAEGGGGGGSNKKKKKGKAR